MGYGKHAPPCIIHIHLIIFNLCYMAEIYYEAGADSVEFIAKDPVFYILHGVAHQIGLRTGRYTFIVIFRYTEYYVVTAHADDLPAILYYYITDAFEEDPVKTGIKRIFLRRLLKILDSLKLKGLPVEFIR